MNEDTLVTINKITMFVWLAIGILSITLAIYCYFTESDYFRYMIGIAAISFLMYGWKRFQMAKFGPQNNS